MQHASRRESLDHLLAQVSRLHYARAHDLLRDLGLHRGQPPLLFALWDEDGQSQSALAERLGIAAATLTRMVQRMERTGFVERRPDRADERLSRVYLTEAGRAVRHGLEDVRRTMAAETCAGLDDQECDLLAGLLQRVHDNLLQRVGEEAPCRP
ncbi:MAG: MarR family transcriptional regulator [Chloroflexi bacterium]|nr:MarR family transcriptional regulator [Chloroflexota bacterium]